MSSSNIVPVLVLRKDDRKEPSKDLKIRNYQLYQLCQQCDTLPDGDQQALVVMMDSLVKKSDMTKVIAKVANG